MDNITYIGESLWPGNLGHFCVVLGFVSALFAAVAYTFHTNNKNIGQQPNRWLTLGRFGFILHAVSTFTIIALVFYAMGSKMYEYSYVRDHVSDDLPMEYIFSAFWGGQEGSFLLWMFWHSVLGLVLLWKSGVWEGPVMAVLSSIEVLLGSMLLGLHLPFGESQPRIGSNPFSLLRDKIDAPIFANADYLSLIDGLGLNPLLQNYWMTIHPPTLFLGFASVSIPFCYAIAGLWTGKHKEWLVPGLKWSLFSSAILGTGILMGAAWAYEALSFGGYWAWDPVENASLVPWLFLIAGVHTNLIAKATNHSIKVTYIFYILSFIFIVYSTFLTRSGILGDTSAHAFTQMGLEWQLVGFLGFFVLLSAFFFFRNHKSIPVQEKEEAFNSKEFWMFIGSIVLFFSGALIIGATSLPVYNKLITSLIDPDFAGYVISDPEEHFNRYQLWIGVFIGILAASTQFLRYKGLNWASYKSKFVRDVAITMAISTVITYFVYTNLAYKTIPFGLLSFAGVYALVGNLYYLVTKAKGNISLAASAVSHMGFGILILGAILSGINKSTITSNPFAQRGLMVEEGLRKSITLVRDMPFFSKGYWITYMNDTLSGNIRTYDLNFRRVDENNELLEEFDLHPTSVYANDFSKIAATNPSTNHYWNKDIFLKITGLPAHLRDVEFAKEMEDTMRFNSFKYAAGDTFRMEDSYGLIHSFTFDPSHPELNNDEHDLVVGLNMSIFDTTFTDETLIQPALGLKSGLIYQFPQNLDKHYMRVKIDENYFANIFTQENELDYEKLYLTEGGTANWDEYEISLLGFNKTPDHKNYEAEDGDIALAGMLQFHREGTLAHEANPVYIIRDSKQFSIKDYLHKPGIHVRFSHIDPQSGQMEFMLAKDIREDPTVPILVAENVPRSDIISIEGIVFPGMHLVWLGSILMMLGLTLGLVKRFGNRI